MFALVGPHILRDFCCCCACCTAVALDDSHIYLLTGYEMSLSIAQDVLQLLLLHVLSGSISCFTGDFSLNKPVVNS